MEELQITLRRNPILNTGAVHSRWTISWL